VLHGFIKKSQKTPPAEMELARKNKALHESDLKREKWRWQREQPGYTADRVSMISWKRRDTETT
jgi:hypothetical protein